jgi:hypothetical protein
MERLVAADQPDEGKILGQIDRVAGARAGFEKANARLLPGLCRVLDSGRRKSVGLKFRIRNTAGNTIDREEFQLADRYSGIVRTFDADRAHQLRTKVQPAAGN